MDLLVKLVSTRHKLGHNPNNGVLSHLIVSDRVIELSFMMGG